MTEPGTSGLPRRLLFGLSVVPLADAYPDVVAQVRAADASGLDLVGIQDHPYQRRFLDTFSLIADLLARTERLSFFPDVANLPLRHPAMIAKAAASLDRMSGGRFELGIGAGWLRAEYEAAGIPFDPAGVRIGRLEEALRVLKGLFAAGAFSFSGSHYAVADLDSFPKPVQRPHPPILVGGGGKRMLSLAAREADIVGVMNASVASGTLANDPAELAAEAVARRVGWVREAAGKRFDALELSTVASVAIAHDHRAAAERFAREQGWDGVSAEEVLTMPSVFVGSAERIADEMRARRERYGFSYFVVSDADMEAVAPVVARLAGG